MKIGIDASRAFLENRTGIEEYAYQVIKNLTVVLHDQQVVLYVRKSATNLGTKSPNGDLVPRLDFELPKSWKIKIIKWPFFWTQAGLSLEMLFHPVDVLFIPAHTVPIVHAKKTIVTIHGLEYEFCPQAYSFWERLYMKVSIKKSCLWASEIISVSENTKKDLMKLYGVAENKIKVIYEGCENSHQSASLASVSLVISNQKNSDSNQSSVISNQEIKKVSHQASVTDYRLLVTDNYPYLLFIGRIEERKNIGNIVKAFEILKEKYEIPHKLVLAGKPGYGWENIKYQISNFKFKEDVIELGFVSEQEKWELLKKAEVFVFPTQYEGFGIPILEAQSVGCPVVASNNSSIVEVAESSALLVNPQRPEEIAEAIYKIISNQPFKKDLIEKGLENVQRFSWEKCAREVAEILER